MPETLRDAAFDLSFDQRGIDGASHIMRRSNFQHADGAEFHVDFNLRHVRAESVNRVGSSLPVFVERAGRRIEGRFAGHHVAMLVERQVSQSQCPAACPFS